MFIVRYFWWGLKIDNLVDRRKEPFIKVLLFFILLVVISTFPYNIQIVRNSGFNILAKVVEIEKPQWQMPFNTTISNRGMESTAPETTVSLEGYEIIFNYQGTDVKERFKDDISTIVLLPKEIIYKPANQNRVVFGDYSKGFDIESINLAAFNSVTGSAKQEMILDLVQRIENCFPYFMLSSILLHVLTQYLIMGIFVVIMAALLQFFRLGINNFFSYLEGVKIVMLTAALPVTLGFIVGWFVFQIAQFIVTFGMGIVTIVVMIRYIRGEKKKQKEKEIKALV